MLLLIEKFKIVPNAKSSRSWRDSNHSHTYEPHMLNRHSCKTILNDFWVFLLSITDYPSKLVKHVSSILMDFRGLATKTEFSNESINIHQSEISSVASICSPSVGLAYRTLTLQYQSND